MGAAWFLNRQRDFIRQLYTTSWAPFAHHPIKIENAEEPWIPPCSEKKTNVDTSGSLFPLGLFRVLLPLKFKQPTLKDWQ